MRLARDTYLEAWGAALFAGGLADGRQPARRLARRGDRARARGPPRPCDLLLDGLALIFTDGRPAAAPALRRAVAAFAGDEASAEEVLRWGWLATRAANFLWDYDSCLEIGMRAVQLARDSGALEVLAVVDNACGQAAAFGGDFALAAAADRGGRRRQGGDRDPHRPARRDRARGAPRPGGRGLRADRPRHRGGDRRRPGDRRPVRALGERPCS